MNRRMHGQKHVFADVCVLAGGPCVLWPLEGGHVFFAGDGLQRLGQNTALEYWKARETGVQNFL